MRYALFTLLALALVFTLISCKKEEQATQSASATESLPAGLFVKAPPAGAVDVVVARKSAKDGERIVIKGWVGGQKEPLAVNRAIMTIADMGLPTCDKTPMDTCETPWDSCCQPPDEISAKRISVQVVGNDGRPLKTGLRGAGGVTPTKHVVVAGIAKMTPGSDSLVVEAQQLYVAP